MHPFQAKTDPTPSKKPLDKSKSGMLFTATNTADSYKGNFVHFQYFKLYKPRMKFIYYYK